MVRHTAVSPDTPCTPQHQAQDYVRSLPRFPKVPFSRLYPNATAEALDMLERLLEFDPAKRITVDEALKHPYLKTYHDPDDEPTHTAFDFAFEQYNRIEELKSRLKRMWRVCGYRLTVWRAQPI